MYIRTLFVIEEKIENKLKSNSGLTVVHPQKITCNYQKNAEAYLKHSLYITWGIKAVYGAEYTAGCYHCMKSHMHI